MIKKKRSLSKKYFGGQTQPKDFISEIMIKNRVPPSKQLFYRSGLIKENDFSHSGIIKRVFFNEKKIFFCGQTKPKGFFLE